MLRSTPNRQTVNQTDTVKKETAFGKQENNIKLQEVRYTMQPNSNHAHAKLANITSEGSGIVTNFIFLFREESD